jgi:two-component system chemotaxis response regulator CheY
MLKKDGYANVRTSDKGALILDKGAIDPPDLIVADYELADMNGLELLEKVRADEVFERTGFIMISSEPERRYVALAAEKKVNAFVVKPFTPDVLAEKVNRVLEQQLNPSEGLRKYREAALMAEGGNLSGALARYQEALEATDYSLAAVYYQMGQIHEKVEKEDEAEDDYQTAVDRTKYYVQASDALGRLKLKKGDVSSAVRLFRDSVDLSPLSQHRQFLLGRAFLEADQPQQAEAALRKALELDPLHHEAFLPLGEALHRQGRHDEALDWMLKALEAYGESGQVLARLGRLYYDTGEIEAAAVHLERALNEDPSLVEAQELYNQIKGGQ